MKIKNKSKKRIDFLDRILSALKHDDIYGTIKYRDLSEARIKEFIYPHLIRELKRYYMDTNNINEDRSYKKAKKNLLWEGNVNTTVNNITFLGVQHRPDMIIDSDLNIAIEIKKGEKGSGIREGIGQSLVYSTIYDFTIYLFIDISKDKKIMNSLNGKREKALIDKLWQDYNIIFEVV